MYDSRIGHRPTPTPTTAARTASRPADLLRPAARRAQRPGGIGLAPNQVLVNFLDNHDIAAVPVRRRPSVPALHNALFFLFTWDGIPAVYYGTEQLFAGGTDPKNREDMFRGNPARGLAPFSTEHEDVRLRVRA